LIFCDARHLLPAKQFLRISAARFNEVPEAVMLVRKLAAASVELLVLAVGAAIAAPYVLILVSPFILGR
jgi:hypothetical protein